MRDKTLLARICHSWGGHTAPRIHVDASGWHYQHWVGPFYPPGLPASRMLAWYAERFRTVELNNTFYRLPPESAAKEWAESVPRDFLFAVKGSRFITHMKKLKDPEPALDRFFSRIEPLGRRLGPILFQLPPQWPPDLDRFAAFLKALPRRHRYAFEFRNPAWHSDEIYRLLTKRRAAFCIFDLAGFTSPIKITANFAYFRLHGPGGKYQGRYRSAALRRWARLIKSCPVRDVYVYFDNDDRGFAALNAAELDRLVNPASRNTSRATESSKVRA